MIRIGQGFDVHQVEPGDGMTLGGLWVPCDYRIVAHSDGDIVLHAVMVKNSKTCVTRRLYVFIWLHAIHAGRPFGPMRNVG